MKYIRLLGVAALGARDVVDAFGRPCKQIKADDEIAIEWLVEKPSGCGGPTMTWGGGKKVG